MNNKTLALLFVIMAAAGHNTQAAEKKSTCMQDLKKGKGVKANMAATIKCQERAIGRLAVAGVLEGDDLKAVLEKQKEFEAAYDDAIKDNKISAKEKKELQALKKEATSAVFETSWGESGMAARLEKMKQRLAKGEDEGQLTADELAVLNEKLSKLEAKLEKLKSGGLSTEEKKKIKEEFRELSRQVFDDRRDDEGNVAPTPDRDKDNIDETRRDQAARIVSCYSDGKNESVITEQIAKLQALRQKERDYFSDGVLSKEEKDDLTQLYKQSGMDIKGVCGTAIRADDSGMVPAAGGDKPADPNHQVAPAN